MRNATRPGRWRATLARGLRAFAGNARGNVAMMFGVALPILLMIGLGAVDVHNASRVKADLQDALDAAALAAARSNYSNAEDIQRSGMDALKANMPNYFGEGAGDTATFILNGNTLKADARVRVKVMVANIILPPYGQVMDDYLPVSTRSEVLRASRNVEVGLALDVTESMKGAPLRDLKDAASELIDIVVQDQQQPFYSKIGLAPYGQGVNLGSRASAARGPVRGASRITDAQWASVTAQPISSISRASPGVVSSAGHGFTNGDYIYLSGIRGMTQLKSGIYQVVNAQANSYGIKTPGSSNALSTRNFSAYTADSGQAQKCLQPQCRVEITSAHHGLSAGEAVYIDGVRGMTQLNGQFTVVTSKPASFVVDLSGPSTLPYSSSGQAWCQAEGCEKFRFTSAAGSTRTFDITPCVSERIGSQAYTDAPPSTALFGRNYTPSVEDCPTSEVIPLSSSRASLKSAIDDLSVSGTTGGQIGIAWGWNLVSPRFASFWGGSGAPGPTEPEKTLKVVVLMTDGEFNTTHCRGVVAADAAITTSYTSRSNRINCNSQNGNGFAQSLALCRAMKSQGIIVYTVGFNLNSRRGNSGVDTAIELMETCATDKATHFHNASSGAELKDAFRSIGRDITRLRISR